MLDGIEWKWISGFEEKYAVTTDGLVYSAKRNKFLKGRKTSTGYLQVILCDGVDRNTFLIHRLVAEAFLGEIKNGMQIDHINGIKTDNRLENLELVTASENIKRAHKNGLKKNFTSDAVYIRCIETNEVFRSESGLARYLGISQNAVKDHLYGKHKTICGMQYEIISEKDYLETIGTKRLI